MNKAYEQFFKEVYAKQEMKFPFNSWYQPTDKERKEFYRCFVQTLNEYIKKGELINENDIDSDNTASNAPQS